MKIIYFHIAFCDIAVCDAPVGSRVYYPMNHPDFRSYKRKEWEILETKKDPPLLPRTRIVPVTREFVKTTANIKRAIRHVHGKLPKRCQKQGILGVVIRGEPERFEGKTYQQLGFFYIPSEKEWEKLYESHSMVVNYGDPPDGLPAETWW